MSTGIGFTRREWLGLLAMAAAFPRHGEPAGPNARPMRGAFIILHTPFTDSGAVDWEDLAREARFVDRCGAGGMVWPQGSSSVASLTKDERMRGMEVLATAAPERRAALVFGVQGRDTAEMLEYARRAEALAPDAMIAMPPSAAKTLDDYRAYFRALGALTSRPVIVQTNGGAPNLTPPTELIVDLAREMPNFGYVKEESSPVVERQKALAAQRAPAGPMKGVFGAQFGNGWLYEMRLGLDGVITGNGMYADVLARLWDLHVAGKKEEVREVYSRFLLMRNLSEQIPGSDLYIMKKRGVFKTTRTRNRTQFTYSPEAIAEIEFRFAALQPYLKIGVG
jgi:dihydrodipicolinate synthase/N-acetylneuraminate lyase